MIFLMLCLPAFSVAGNIHIIPDFNFTPDTVNVIVYDTIYTYDTIYEYVEVQETVYVFDTVLLYQMPVIGIPDSFVIIHVDSSLFRNEELLERYAFEQPEETSHAVKTKKKNRHPDRWYSLDNEKGNNPVPFGYDLRSKSAFDLHFEGYIPSINIKEGVIPFTDTLRNRLSAAPSWRQTLSYHHTFGRMQLSAGAGISKLNINTIFDENVLVIDTTFPWNFFQREETVYDTTWFLDMDALLQGDTVWIPFVETSTVMVDDSLQTQKIDTSLSKRQISGSTSFLFLEIPVGLSYTFLDHNNWEASVYGGISAAFYMQQSGPLYSPETGNIIADGVSEAVRLHFKGRVGAAVHYRLSSLSMIYLTAGYGTSLNNLLDGAQYRLSYNELSVGIGFRYQILSNY